MICYCPSLASGRCDFCTGVRSIPQDYVVLQEYIVENGHYLHALRQLANAWTCLEYWTRTPDVRGFLPAQEA